MCLDEIYADWISWRFIFVFEITQEVPSCETAFFPGPVPIVGQVTPAKISAVLEVRGRIVFDRTISVLMIISAASGTSPLRFFLVMTHQSHQSDKLGSLNQVHLKVNHWILKGYVRQGGLPFKNNVPLCAN